ncbi:teichoic acid biosynthesis protein [Bacillus safensis]|uniref:phage baseplate protein n=1 Tax=Bacillus safensis TaxID=561879 RepID=UPI00203F7493|nr:teichoic acid biosynthesis protein [Bacillus safensis]MCM3140391.1 teichoic acid biosynthesis protein [Bacillus safensis]
MANVYLKRISANWDRSERNNLNNNFSQIERGFSQTDTDLRNHKNDSKAHASEHINHGDLSVSQEIETTKTRIRNLVLNHDGNDVKEVVDARVSRKGSVYPSLRDRLNGNESELEDLNQIIEKEMMFDYTTVSPVYHTHLNLKDPTVLQCFVIDEETGDIYATQVTYGTTGSGRESYTLTRLNKNGVMLDSMLITDGGHGTTIGIERENGRVYIWSNYNIVNSGSVVGNELVRFPYVAGTTMTRDNGMIERYNKFNDLYTIPVIDQQNGLIAFRMSIDGTSSVVELRNLADVKNGVNKMLGKVTVPNDLHYLQGFTIDGYDLYWYTGDTNSVNYPAELALFSFRDGLLKKRITCDFGRGYDGRYEDDFREPESVFLYKDPKTGKKSLFAGVVTGAVGKRQAKVYAYHSKENSGKFANDLSSERQGYALSQNNGAAKRLPDGLKSLKDYKKPGLYYMKTSETKTLEDHPDKGNAGWWLSIAPSDSTGAVIQTLTRNSTGRTIKVLTRVVTNAGMGEWAEIATGGKLPWANLPPKNGAKNPDANNRLQFAVQGGFLHLRGRVTIPRKDGIVFAVLPEGARPTKNIFTDCQVAGTTGVRKISLQSNGDIRAYGLMANNAANATSTYVDVVIKLG